MLLALLTQERINALFDLSKTLELPGEEGLPENMRLTDSTEAEAAVPRGDVPRRPKNKRDRLQEQKEKQARLEAEVAERARREAEAAAKVEEERLRLEQEEVRKQAEEADRLKAEQRKQAREAANEKKRIEKEKKRISRDRYRARKRQEKLDALANPSSAPPVPAPVERPNTRRKGVLLQSLYVLVGSDHGRIHRGRQFYSSQRLSLFNATATRQKDWGWAL